MIPFEKIYKHLKRIKVFEDNKSKNRILTFTVTPHWHNFLLLISGVLASRGVIIDYFWNDRSPKKSLLISAEKSAARKIAGLSEFNSIGTPNSLRDVEPSTNYILRESAKLNWEE